MSYKSSDRQLQLVVLKKIRRAVSTPSILLFGCCAACGSTYANLQSAGGASSVLAGGGGAPTSAGAPSSSGSAGLAPSGGAGSSGSTGSGVAGASGAATSAGGSSGGPSAGAANGGAAASGAANGGGNGGGVSSGGVSSVGDGDFTVGPTYTKSSDLSNKGSPAGKSFHFTLSSANSLFKGTDSTLAAANQHSFTRGIDVYIPAKYKNGSAAPFIVIQDGPGQLGNIKLALDNLTQSTDPARRLPAFIAIAVANGGGDSIGSERGLEYDTMSDRYAQFVQTEVLPAVLADASIKAAYPGLALTADPDGRATIGCSSGAAAALTMGWFHPEWFRRIVTYSGTFVAQQNPAAAEKTDYPHGAWDYHSDLKLIEATPVKPLRVFINANQNDNGATAAESGRHNWLMANQRTAAAFKAKGYHYRFVEGLGASHCQGSVQDLTLPDALLWVWRGYPTE